MSNINFINAPQDPNGSTFYHKFNYDCGKSIPGYSKKEGFPELKDKRSLLAGTLNRLFNLKYYESPIIEGRTYGKFISLELFKNSSKNGWVHIATLHQDYLDVNNDAINPELGNLLWHFQKEFKNGSISDSFLSKFCKKKDANKDELELRYRFYDKMQLQNHCKRLVNKNSSEINRIQEFYKDYCNQFFDGLTDADQKFYDNLKYYKP
jgi:hypothetical protein